MDVEVTLERMSSDACAVGHLRNGKTVFVEGGVSGDVVAIEVCEEHPNYCRARIAEIIAPSVHRVAARCTQGKSCGSCSWQHIAYGEQLVAKRQNVVSALVHVAKIPHTAAETLVLPTLPSAHEWGYRNKLELQAALNKQGVFNLGFCNNASHEIASIPQCLLANSALQNAPKALCGALRYVQGNNNLGIFRVGVRASERTGQLEIALWTAPSAFPRSACANILQNGVPGVTSIVRVLANPGKARAVKKVEVLYGRGYWEEVLCGCTFATSAPSFFQVNSTQAENLIAYVVEHTRAHRGARVADLYAGGGTFSVPLAKAGAQVLAIEAAGSSVRDLARNARKNKVEIEVIGGDAARQIQQIERGVASGAARDTAGGAAGDAARSATGGTTRNTAQLDALVVDPPRAGLAPSVIESIAQLSPDTLVYISCNPSTWARDVARFATQGYALAHVQPFDMFPQTHHVEVASTFVRA